jgi:gluconolactonase
VDPSFNRYKLGLRKVERIAFELPLERRSGVVRRRRYLLWSDIPNNRMMRWDEETAP